MSRTRFSKLLLVVLALALWAGTASAQTIATNNSTLTYSYTKGATTASQTAQITDPTDATAYTAAVNYNLASGSNAWLVVTTGAGTIGSPSLTGTCGTTADTLTMGVAATVTAAMAPGSSYQATITLTAADTSTVQISVALTVNSPLAASTPANTSMTWVAGGAATQPASVASGITITNATDSSYDLYTVLPSVSTCPAWLMWKGNTGTLEAKSGTTDTLVFGIDSTKLAGTTSQTVTNCTAAVQYLGVTFKTITFAMLAIVSQPLLATSPTPALLVYNKGSGIATVATNTFSMKVAAGTSSTQFYLDVATMPVWLGVQSGLSSNSANATSTGNVITFAVSTTVAAGMSTGNYTANIGFYAAGFQELQVPISLQISNSAPSVTVLPNTSPTNVPYTSSMGNPQPTATLYSTDEPIPFTATCTVTKTGAYTASAPFSTNSCQLNGTTSNVVNGTTFTWGYLLTATLDPALFTATFGNTVTVTFAFSNMGSATLSNVVYIYTLQPGTATIASSGGINPTSASVNFSKTSFLPVTIKGTNFYGPGSFINSSTVSSTMVWVAPLGATTPTLLTASNATTVGSYVVVDPTHIVVTILGSVFPTVAAGKTGTVVIGVANQTGSSPPAAAQATANLNITSNPVIYGMTSSASYVQPPIGANPSFAPYELISIFGDNFGFATLATLTVPITSASASLDGFNKVITPMTLGTPAGTGAKALTLAVTFKDVASGHTTLTAPVLFANNNQINAIVPSGVVGDQYVAVTAAGSTSDNFVVHTVAADPGIFTLASDGTGQAAIINGDLTINGSGHPAKTSDIIQIYLAGLGAPDSSAVDAAPTQSIAPPLSCVAISNLVSGSPGWMQQVNHTKVTGTGAYTPPSPAWTNIDGAVVTYGPYAIIAGTTPNVNYPPCMATATISVTFGTAANSFQVTGANIPYAGFVSGSVAGLYQMNVQLPSSFGGLTGLTPVQVSITPLNASQPILSQIVEILF